MFSEPSEAVAERVQELLHTGSVRCSPSGMVAWVHGRTEWYKVQATASGIVCTCRRHDYGGESTCSHVYAAMVAWKEQRLVEPETPFG